MVQIQVSLRVFVLTILLAMLSGQAIAQNKQSIDKAQAVKNAQQQIDGRVLKVDQNKRKYRVKMLKKSGRVVSVDVDKRSGKVTSKKKKDY